MLKRLAPVFLLCSFAPAAFAGVTSHTNYQYFPVSGRSAGSILDSMRSGSSAVGMKSTFANTDYDVTTDTVKSKGPNCRLTGVNVSITYTIHLPRLTDEGAMPPDVRNDWRSFMAYLRGHEDHHKALWSACIARFNNSVRSLIGSDCGSADAKVDARWNAAEGVCRAENDRYNAYAARAVHGQRFVQRARNGD